MTFRELLRKPSALLPLAFSAAALALVLGYVILFGVTRNAQGDEGAAARLFQLLMAAQGLTMAVFAITWLPRAFRSALLILALQVGAAAVPLGTIIALER